MKFSRVEQIGVETEDVRSKRDGRLVCLEEVVVVTTLLTRLSMKKESCVVKEESCTVSRKEP